ncbi:MAG: hypothetical protein M1818_004220 [Claussenomyces sp. TS43310]|nr:MAG: hypothetical protein M1818_004220 [Claussenomyces sp. TS43310]
MDQQSPLKSSPCPRPLSADFASYVPAPSQESMLYSMLPAAVQSRLPRIPSLRRSVNMYGSATRTSKRATTSRPDTPPDDYRCAVVLRSATSNVKGGDVVDYYAEQTSEEEEDSGRFMSNRSERQGIDVTEGKSGIGWKYAGQGLNLLSLSVEESSAISRNDTYGNASFARQLYIHAMTYLLRGLPTDMTAEEQSSVRSALPTGVASPLRVDGVGQPSLNPSTSTRASQVRHPPSVVQRALASSIVQLIILFSFFLPYIRLFLKRAYDYERKNRVTERVLAGSLETADGLSRKGWGLSAAIWGAGLGDVLGWMLEEVGAGVREGVGEGMGRITQQAEHQ